MQDDIDGYGALSNLSGSVALLIESRDGKTSIACTIFGCDLLFLFSRKVVGPLRGLNCTGAIVGGSFLKKGKTKVMPPLVLADHGR